MRLALPLSALLLLTVTASGIEPRAVLGDRPEILLDPHVSQGGIIVPDEHKGSDQA